MRGSPPPPGFLVTLVQKKSLILKGSQAVFETIAISQRPLATISYAQLKIAAKMAAKKPEL